MHNWLQRSEVSAEGTSPSWVLNAAPGFLLGGELEALTSGAFST